MHMLQKKNIDFAYKCSMHPNRISNKEQKDIPNTEIEEIELNDIII